MPEYKPIRLTVTTEFRVSGAPVFEFTTTKGKQARFQPSRVVLTRVNNTLTTVEINGFARRSDDSEITWQQHGYKFNEVDAAAMPEWLATFLSEHGWALGS